MSRDPGGGCRDSNAQTECGVSARSGEHKVEVVVGEVCSAITRNGEQRREITETGERESLERDKRGFQVSSHQTKMSGGVEQARSGD